MKESARILGYLDDLKDRESVLDEKEFHFTQLMLSKVAKEEPLSRTERKAVKNLWEALGL